MAAAASTPTVTQGLKCPPDTEPYAKAKAMTVKPGARATAVTPLRPAPPPTTAPAPAPININVKVPMNSARSLGAREFGIADLQEWVRIVLLGAIRVAPENHALGCGPPIGTGVAPAGEVDRAYSSIDQLRLFEPEGLRHPSPVCRSRARAIVDVPLLDVQLGVAHRPRRVLEQHLLLLRRHLPEQVAGLLPVVIVDAVVKMGRVALDRHRRLGEIRLVIPEPRTVRMIIERSAQISVGAHLAVAVVAVKRAFWGVDRDVVEVDAEPVTLRVAIGEQPGLKHFVG